MTDTMPPESDNGEGARKPNLTLSAPLGSIDLAAIGYPIWPCPACLPWHVDIVIDPETGDPIAREWHAVDCAAFRELIDDDRPEGAEH